MIRLALFSILIASSATAGIMDDFDTLGGNQTLLERAQKLDPDKKIAVVQERTVARRNRLEASVEGGAFVGGDSYMNSRSAGLNLQWHFTPRFSLGVRGSYFFNSLSEEGKDSIAKAQSLEESASPEAKNELRYYGLIPDIDYPRHSAYLVGNWYPIYGKMNLLEAAIVQYDLYLLGGGGVIELKSGRSNAYTAGGGFGVWLSQHLTSRFEVRWETWEAQRSQGKERMNMTGLALSMGYLL